MVKQYHAFLIQCAQFEFAKRSEVRVSQRFDIAVLDVSGSCFSHVALVDDDALRRCPYSYQFASAHLAWVNFSTGLRPPVNTNKFRAGKWPSYAMRELCPCSLLLEAFTSAEDLRTFQATLKWFRKHIHVALFPGDCVVKCRSLYVLGYSPTKGVSYRLKHTCEPDPRAHLRDLFMQRPARLWSFDFHITPPRN